MRRFTVAPGQIQGDRVAFDPQESRHMAVVLRLAPGDLVVAADGAGRDYTVRLDSLGVTASGTIVAVADTRAESPMAVTLVQAVPKGDRMEQIVRAATELGASRIAPALTERTIVRLPPWRWPERARRWQRVAREAAKQCGRAIVPDVGAPAPLADRLALAAGVDLALCLWEGQAPPLVAVLDAVPAPPRTAAVLVGPEGGLAAPEVEAARTRGWRPVTLGSRVLRTETAGPAILAILQFRFGDLGGAPRA